jgi:4-amino-4-deoxy-L-arabinose transferase-like glycosyltransferase
MALSDGPNVNFWRDLLVAIGLACVVRGGWLWGSFHDLRADPDSYRQLAVSVLETGTFGYRVPSVTGAASMRPTAFRPPLYPLLLAGVGWLDHVGLTSISVLHFVMGAGTAVLVWFLGRRWQLGGWAVVASVLVACDPILLRHSSLVMTETAATLCAVLGLLCLTRLTNHPTTRGGVLAGSVFGLMVLCRPTFLVWCSAIVLVALFVPNVRRHWRAGLGFLAAAGAVLAPWVLRNFLVFDRPMATTTHGGYTLWLGNNEFYYRFLAEADWRAVWRSDELDAQCSQMKEHLGHDELLADRWAYQQARECIRRNPGMFIRASLGRVASLWGLVPHQIDPAESAGTRFGRYAVGVSYALLFLLAAAGACHLGRRLWQPPWLWGLLLCLSFTAVHTVYWSNLRMRAPLMPVICLAAAVGVSRLWSLCHRGPINLSP